MSPLDADFYVSKLVPQAVACFEQIVPDDCFNGAVPGTYLLCESDNCVPPFVPLCRKSVSNILVKDVGLRGVMLGIVLI